MLHEAILRSVEKLAFGQPGPLTAGLPHGAQHSWEKGRTQTDRPEPGGKVRILRLLFFLEEILTFHANGCWNRREVIEMK